MSLPFTTSEPYECNGDIIVDINDGTTTWMVTDQVPRELTNIYNMELRKDDVWLLGSPKSGNSWASEMLFTVYLGIDKANEKPYMDRVCNPEMRAYQCMGLNTLPEEKRRNVTTTDYFKQADECESPRVLRSHLPFPLLPNKLLDTCKVIYICRNLKDVVVSFYKMFEGTGLSGDFNMETYAHLFMTEKGLCQPVCEQIKQAWEKRHHPNMYFLFYEDMKKDLPSVLHKVAAFVGKSLTNEQVKELQEYLSVDAMRKNKNLDFDRVTKEIGILGENSHFIRKGISGDWKNHFTPALTEKFNAWIEEKFAGTDFKFPE